MNDNYENLENTVVKAGGENAINRGKKAFREYKDQRDLSKLSKDLKKKGKDLEKLQRHWISTLEGGAVRSLMKKPRKMAYGLASKLPGRVGDYFDEKGEVLRDPLNVIETGYKGYLDSIEDILIQIGQMSIEEKKELITARETYEQAKQEKWPVAELRQTISDELGIAVDGAISDILNDLNDDLEPEQLERKRENMLGVIEDNMGVRDEMVKLLLVVAKEGGEIYDKATLQYYGFAQMKQKAQMYRDANLEFAGMQALSLDTKDMMVDMISKATNVAEAAIESIHVLEKNMIASKDMQAKVAASRERLTNTLEKVLTGDIKLKSGKIKYESDVEKVRV